MIDFGKMKNSPAALATCAAALVAVGATGGAGAVQATRPSVEMAPTVRTPIAKLATTNGVVTVKGRVAEVFGDRFVVQDASGRAMIAAGRDGRNAVTVGQPVIVQGRFDDGQLRASYLVNGNGTVAAVGPRGPRSGRPDVPGGLGRHGGPSHDGPPPPGCAAAPAGRGAPDGMSPPPPDASAPAAGGFVRRPAGALPQPSAAPTPPSVAPNTSRR